jgi:hypothetical protein
MLGSQGAQYMETNLRVNTSIHAIILDNNNFGDSGIQFIATIMTRHKSIAQIRYKYIYIGIYFADKYELI